MIHIFLLSLFFCFSPAIFPASADTAVDAKTPIENLLTRAARYHDENDPKAAAGLLATVVERAPENGEYRLLLARALQLSEQYEEALTQLREAKKSLGDIPRIWLMAAENNQALNKSYLPLVEKALARDPDNRVGWRLAAVYFLGLKKTGETQIEKIKNLLSLGGESSPERDVVRAVAESLSEGHARVKSLLLPHKNFFAENFPPPLLLLAKSLEALGEQAESTKLVELFERKNKGGTRDSNLLSAKNLKEQGDLEAAIIKLEKAIKENDKLSAKDRDKSLLAEYGHLLREAGKLTEAKKILRRAMEEDAAIGGAIGLLGIILEEGEEARGDPSELKKRIAVADKILAEMKGLGKKGGREDEIQTLVDRLDGLRTTLSAVKVQTLVDSADYKKAVAEIDRNLKTEMTREGAEEKIAILEKTGDLEGQIEVLKKLKGAGLIAPGEFEERRSTLHHRLAEFEQITIYQSYADELERAGKDKEAKKFRSLAAKLEKQKAEKEEAEAIGGAKKTKKKKKK